MKARLTLTDEQGIVHRIWEDEDLGDLTKKMARQALILDITYEVGNVHMAEPIDSKDDP